MWSRRAWPDAGRHGKEVVRAAEEWTAKVVERREAAVGAIHAEAFEKRMEDIDADVLEAKLHEAHNCGVGHPTYAMALGGGGGGETRLMKRWLSDAVGWHKKILQDRQKAVDALHGAWVADAAAQDLARLNAKIEKARVTGVGHPTYQCLVPKAKPPKANGSGGTGPAADGTNHAHHTNGNGGSHGHSGSADASRGAASPTPTTLEHGHKVLASACKWADKITKARGKAARHLESVWRGGGEAETSATREQDTAALEAAIGAARADGVDHPSYCLEATGEHGEARVAAATAWLETVRQRRRSAVQELLAAWHSDMAAQDVPLLQERLDVAKAVGVAHKTWRDERGSQNKAVGDERGSQIVHAAGEWIKQVASARKAVKSIDAIAHLMRSKRRNRARGRVATGGAEHARSVGVDPEEHTLVGRRRARTWTLRVPFQDGRRRVHCSGRDVAKGARGERGGGGGGGGGGRGTVSPDGARAAAGKRLEAATKKVSSVDDAGSEAASHALAAAVAAAEKDGVDILVLNPARRRLKELEALAQKAKLDRAKGKLAQTIAAVEAAAQAAVDEGGAPASLLLHVYEKHPPTTPSLELDALRALMPSNGAGPGGAAPSSSAVKKAYLKAQRDYHPDRNVGNPRDTFGYGPEEWEALSSAICQQLSRTYDQLFKGERLMEEVS